jgi:shikimate dehydrogenase
MKTYISLSSHPGTTGKYFYTKFFEHYGIDAVYEPRGADDLKLALEQAKDVDGISISMPFKKEIIHYLDKSSELADKYQLCNTVKFEDGVATGYNCDFNGMVHVTKYLDQFKCDRISILGDGAMGSMFANWLDPYTPSVFSRKSNTWQNRHIQTDAVINCTAIGTVNTESPIKFLPLNTRIVIDLALKDNQLKELCIHNNIKYVSGREFYKFQFLSQFEIYTGISPSEEIYDQFEIELYEKI